MESSNVLADDVNIRRPKRLEERLVVRAVADRRDVVQKRVEPDVNRLLGVERDWNAPGEPFARDRDVLKPRFHQADNLVATVFGLDEVGMGVVVRQEPVLEGGKPKEIVFLFDFLQRREGMIRTAAVFQLFLGLERFAAVAIKAGIGFFINISRVVDRLDELVQPR